MHSKQLIENHPRNTTPEPQDRAEASGRKKVFIKSYGCQMNVYDSDRMMDVLTAEGYGAARDADEASLVILNTCHIREKAAEKVYSELGKLRKQKEARRDPSNPLKVVVAGCVAQAEGGEILRRQPAVDVVIGPQNYHNLGKVLREADSGHKIVDTQFPLESKFDFLPSPTHKRATSRGVSAFVTVQEGCDKFCTFCVVPYTRGAEVSRPVEEILAEIEKLTAAGVREIMLIGQNVNAYHGRDGNERDASLAGLIAAVADMPGVYRIRYTTSHPRDMRDDLLDAHVKCDKLMPFLHLPVQSGSDHILHEMNRKHRAEDFTILVDRLRQVRPDIALSSDFIVGFPGETEDDFRATMKLAESVNFASAYTFKYSARPGTPGSQLEETVSEEVKSRRLKELQDLLDEQRRAYNHASVGRVEKVLFEKTGRRPGQLVGKTPHMLTVQVDADNDLIGSVVEVRLREAGSNTLFGDLVESTRV